MILVRISSLLLTYTPVNNTSAKIHSQSVLTPLMLETEYSGFGDQYHACWCPGSQSRQSISKNAIDSRLFRTSSMYCCSINPLHAKFFRENINIYLHFMSFLPVFGAGFENNLSIGQVAQKIHLSWCCSKLSQILKKSQHLDNYRLAG